MAQAASSADLGADQVHRWGRIERPAILKLFLNGLIFQEESLFNTGIMIKVGCHGRHQVYELNVIEQAVKWLTQLVA